jgi:hypothetical protein
MKRLRMRHVSECSSAGEFLNGTYLTTLSMLWKTMEFRHIAIATALFPKVRQKVLIKSLLDLGKTQILSMQSMLTK